MRKTALILLLLVTSPVSCLLTEVAQARRSKNIILSVTMHLSALGVESDTYPSITATLDFERRTSRCGRSYYDPAYRPSTYQLSAAELSQVQQLLQRADLSRLKPSYSVRRTDQPTSTMTIHTASQTFIIRDYGLEGAVPLPELYRLVYKFEY